MGTKLVRVGRKLARVGRRLVTTAGGAPCCCGGGGGGPCTGACTQAMCEQCTEGTIPKYFGWTPSSGTIPLAAVQAVTAEVFEGYKCATCQRSTVVIQPWSFTATNLFVEVEFSAPELTLCRVDTTTLSFFGDLLNSGSGTGIWWAYSPYGFWYADYATDGNKQSNCAWLLTPGTIPASAFNIRLSVDPEYSGVEYDYDGPPASVEVRAFLLRLSEDKSAPFGSGGPHQSVVGVILVVEYVVTLPSGDVFVIYPAPGGAGPGFGGTDTDVSSLVNIKDWGGWISCLGVEAASPAITSFEQTLEPCAELGLCAINFQPNGATVYQPSPVGDLPPNYFTFQWPKGGSTGYSGTYTSLGFGATIGEAYGQSCEDDPLFTLV